MHDSTKTIDEREEDAEFVRRLRRNEYVAFGALDAKRLHRFERAAKRRRDEKEREEREEKRKKVTIVKDGLRGVVGSLPVL